MRQKQSRGQGPRPSNWTQTLYHQDPELGQMTQLTPSSNSQAGEEDNPT